MGGEQEIFVEERHTFPAGGVTVALAPLLFHITHVLLGITANPFVELDGK